MATKFLTFDMFKMIMRLNFLNVKNFQIDNRTISFFTKKYVYSAVLKNSNEDLPINFTLMKDFSQLGSSFSFRL